MKTEPITLLIAEMKNAGPRENHWSDDDQYHKRGGPDYVRLKARSAAKDDHTLLTLEVPNKVGARFRVGAKITVIAGGA
jgi:hypothetical protein